MKKKGFTLIELLAVIVILAIIVLVAMPILSGIMTNVKIKSLKNSGYGIMEASNLYHAMYSNKKTVRFDIKDDKITSDETNKIKYSGSIKEGTVLIDKKGNVALCLKDGNNSVYKNFTEKDIIEAPKGVCSFESGSYIVYLNGAKTKAEYTNEELTSRVEELQAQINTLTNALNEKANQSDLETVSTISNSKTTLNEVYPVGSIYMTMEEDTAAKVGAKLGGTWEQIESGRMLQSTSSNSGSKGGQASVSYTPAGSVGNHTLTVAEMPSHSHATVSTGVGCTQNWPRSVPHSPSYDAGSTACAEASFPSGGSQAHNHPFTGTRATIATMPPYITVYMYKRVS